MSLDSRRSLSRPIQATRWTRSSFAPTARRPLPSVRGDTPCRYWPRTASLTLIVLVLWDAFEAMLLPRRVTRHLRFARLYLRLRLDALGRPGAADAAGQAAEDLPERLRAAVAARPVRPLGGRADRRLRPAALVARLAPARPGGRPRPRHLPVLQRRDLLHARLRRRDPDSIPGPCPGGRRGGPRLRLPGRRHRLPAGALPGVLAPRDDHLAARRPRRLAADGRRAAAPAGRRPRASPARTGSWRSGSAGRPSCWRATCRSRC